MGKETSQSEVEESTESRIGSSSLNEGPVSHLPSPENASTAQKAQHLDPPVSQGKQPTVHLVEKDPNPPAAPLTASAGECKWAEHYQHAHTFAASDIARILDVDLQYVDVSYIFLFAASDCPLSP
jgi:hypothetical protein